MAGVLPLMLLQGTPQTAAAASADKGPRVMVVAANPLAVDAGLRILQAGGSAADAAVAMQAVLGLVEPQSSGLGGGAFITYYDARIRTVRAYDGREVAPALATPDMFLGEDGKPLEVAAAMLSGRSTGVPGAVAALASLHKEHGKLAWKNLFGDAERLAAGGFVVSPRMARMINSQAPQADAPDARRYFTKPDGQRYGAGDLLTNPAYAATLERLAEQGPAAIYAGPIAQDIVTRVHEGELPGALSLDDIARYKPIESEALCRRWRVYLVCTPAIPSGGIGVLQGLLLLQNTDIAQRNPTDPIAWVKLAQAERLMYADRNRYVGDPAFVRVPVAGMLDSKYIKHRSALIGERATPTPPTPGTPPGAAPAGPDRTREPGGTTHFVIVDAGGNVVSMTTTVESVFGSGRMVDGFFLNNQLTDFSFSPIDPDDVPAANAVAPGKRPRSAMSPTIVLDAQGRFVAAVGSAGGPAIIAYVLKTLIGVLDWHLSMQAAINLPNLVAHDANYSAETSKFAPSLVHELAARGVNVHPGQYEESGLQGVLRHRDGVLEGGTDSHREGVARGY